MNVARAACAAGEFQSGALSLLQQTHKTQRPRAQSPRTQKRLHNIEAFLSHASL